MSGTNPYQTSEAAALPKQAYRLTFLPMDLTVDVDPEELPASGEGLPGSILDIALANDIDIDHACGGVCASYFARYPRLLKVTVNSVRSKKRNDSYFAHYSRSLKVTIE